jgi:hypothetical protein
MKRFTIFIFGLISFLFINYNSAQSCTSTTITMTVEGCDFDVVFCADCPTGPAPGTISIERIIITDPNCWAQTGLNLGDLYQEIWLMANNYLFITDYLCPGLNAPPCPSQSQVIQINHWICWKVQCYFYFGNLITDVDPCSYNSYCLETWTWCYDAIHGKYISTPGIPSLVGNPDCSLGPLDIEIPTQPNTETECFEMPTACNP